MVGKWGTVINSYNTGDIIGTSSFNGGLVGSCYGPIVNSYNTGAVSGTDYIGGLAGDAYDVITNSHNTGTVQGNGATGAVGGLVGFHAGASAAMSNSYNTGAVQGTHEVGGLTGSNSAPVSNSYSTGAVSGTYNIGGLVGSNASSISNSYSRGTVQGVHEIGGLIGNNDSNTNAVNNTYSTGLVTGAGANVGGLVGLLNTGTITNSFWDRQTSGQANSAAGAGKTTAEMMRLATFTAAGWGIDDAGGTGNVWRIYNGHTTPLLRSFLKPLTISTGNVTKTTDGFPYSGGMVVDYTPAGYDASKIFGTPTYGNATAAGSYVIPLGLYSNQQGYDITTSGTLTIVDGGSSLTMTGLSDTNYQDISTEILINKTLLMMEKQAMIMQRHEMRTMLFSEALAELRENPEVADVPPCQAGKSSDEGLCLHVPEAQANPESKGRRIALLIGNNDYQAPIPSLTTPIKDVEKIGAILHDSYGYEVRSMNNAGKVQIIQALNKIAKEAGATDSVLLFYAGHGYLMDDTRMGYWIPTDGSVKTAAKWISNSDITKLLQAIPAAQVMLVSDSCYSGTLTREQKLRASRNAIIKDKLRLRSVLAFSSGGEEPVSDEGKEGHSIFAWNFIKSLENVKDTALGYEIYSNVTAGVKADYPQVPQYGAVITAGHMTGGEYVFEKDKAPPH